MRRICYIKILVTIIPFMKLLINKTMQKTKICPIHNIEKVQLFNSTLFVCPECEKEKRYKASSKRREENKALLTQSYSNEKKNRKKVLKSNKTKSRLDKQLDAAWSLLVKIQAGNKCAYCGSSRALNSHHIFSRAKKSVRWKTSNGICLCVNHHIGVQFSAHKTPFSFIKWITKKMGVEFMDKLEILAHSTANYTEFEKELMLKDLQTQIKKFQDND